jgi:hypothetical protein
LKCEQDHIAINFKCIELINDNLGEFTISYNYNLFFFFALSNSILASSLPSYGFLENLFAFQH